LAYLNISYYVSLFFSRRFLFPQKGYSFSLFNIILDILSETLQDFEPFIHHCTFANMFRVYVPLIQRFTVQFLFLDPPVLRFSIKPDGVVNMHPKHQD
jgi:hypothetical protein